MTSTSAPPSTDLLEYRFRWSAAEHRAFYRALQREVSRRGVLRFVVPAGFLVFAAVAIFAILDSALSTAEVIITLAPYVLLFVLWIALLKWGMAYVSARRYQRAHAACIPHDQIRIISPDGLEARCMTSTVTVRWAGIERVVETAEFFLFFTTPSCAIQLPSHAVANEGGLEQLRATLRKYVGARAELAAQESAAPVA